MRQWIYPTGARFPKNFYVASRANNKTSKVLIETCARGSFIFRIWVASLFLTGVQRFPLQVSQQHHWLVGGPQPIWMKDWNHSKMIGGKTMKIHVVDFLLPHKRLAGETQYVIKLSLNQSVLWYYQHYSIPVEKTLHLSPFKKRPCNKYKK